MSPGMAERWTSLAPLELPLRTPRLDLSPPTTSSIPEILRLLGDRRVSKWLLAVPYPLRRSHELAWIRSTQRRRRASEGLGLLARERRSGDVVGGIGLQKIDWSARHAEVGYWLGRPYWRMGYGSEMLTAVLDLSFRRAGLHRIEAGIFAGNRRSEQLLLRQGFHLEGVRREHWRRNGRWIDEPIFGLTAAEWRTHSRHARAPTPESTYA